MNTERTLGAFRISVDRDGQPPGWAFLRIIELNGVPHFQGVVPVDEVAIETITALERARLYDAAARGEPDQDPDWPAVGLGPADWSAVGYAIIHAGGCERCHGITQERSEWLTGRIGEQLPDLLVPAPYALHQDREPKQPGRL